jgi:flap endonuclease-1
MGVKQFHNAFGKAGVPIKNMGEIVKNKKVMVDISEWVCRSVKAMYQCAHLTDSTGIPTAGTNAVFNNIVRLMRMGAEVFGVCDNKLPNPHKNEEHKKRRAIRAVAKQKAEDADDDCDKLQHEATAWSLTDEVINDAQMLMYLLGVEFHVAPHGREAEQYAANLAISGEIDIVISNDTDAVMFGAPIVIFNNTDKKTKGVAPFVVYNIVDILTMYDISMHEFQKICVTLGTDFAHKTPGVGPSRAFTTGKNKALSEEQELALVYIQSKPDDDSVVQISKSLLDKPALIEWLVNIKGFNRERVVKKLKGI